MFKFQLVCPDLVCFLVFCNFKGCYKLYHIFIVFDFFNRFHKTSKKGWFYACNFYRPINLCGGPVFHSQIPALYKHFIFIVFVETIVTITKTLCKILLIEVCNLLGKTQGITFFFYTLSCLNLSLTDW